MGQATDQAQQQRELTKRRLAATLDRVETRIRSELDWRERLRRDGARYAAIGGAIVITTVAVVVLRWRFGRREAGPEVPHLTSLNDLSVELAAVREELERIRKHQDRTPLWQRGALRAATAAGSAAGAVAMRQMMVRQAADAEPAGDPVR